jgi:hypothetical protein
MQHLPATKAVAGTDFAQQLAEMVQKASALLPTTAISQCRAFHGLADIPDVKVISTTTYEATDADA